MRQTEHDQLLLLVDGMLQLLNGCRRSLGRVEGDYQGAVLEIYRADRRERFF